MSSPAPAVLGAFYQSPYAVELQRGPSLTCESPTLESEYIDARLIENRTLIRLACGLAVIICLLRGTEQTIIGYLSGMAFVIVAFALVTSIVLAAIVWSSKFLRWYLPVARIAVPARNLVVAIPMAAMAATGQTEILVAIRRCVRSRARDGRSGVPDAGYRRVLATGTVTRKPSIAGRLRTQNFRIPESAFRAARRLRAS